MVGEEGEEVVEGGEAVEDDLVVEEHRADELDHAALPLLVVAAREGRDGMGWDVRTRCDTFNI